MDIVLPEVLFGDAPSGHDTREEAEAGSRGEHIGTIITPYKLCQVFLFVVIGSTTEIIQTGTVPRTTAIVFLKVSTGKHLVYQGRDKILTGGIEVIRVNGFTFCAKYQVNRMCFIKSMIIG